MEVRSCVSNMIEKCQNKSCEYAHSAIELDFVNGETKIRNLQNTIKRSTEKMIKSRAREPWRPAKSGSIDASMEIKSYDRINERYEKQKCKVEIKETCKEC